MFFLGEEFSLFITSRERLAPRAKARGLVQLLAAAMKERKARDRSGPALWMYGSKLKGDMDRRFWSVFPLTRATHLGCLFLTHSHVGAELLGFRGAGLWLITQGLSNHFCARVIIPPLYRGGVFGKVLVYYGSGFNIPQPCP